MSKIIILNLKRIMTLLRSFFQLKNTILEEVGKEITGEEVAGDIQLGLLSVISH